MYEPAVFTQSADPVQMGVNDPMEMHSSKSGESSTKTVRLYLSCCEYGYEYVKGESQERLASPTGI